MEGKVRVRSINFTPAEKQVLLSLINKYKETIENKKTDNVSSNEKTITWTKIAEEFNSQSPALVMRTVESLKKYYENLKKTIRKKAASERSEMYQTGGGKTKTKMTEDDELLLTLVNKKTIYGLKNPFDNDQLPSTSWSQDHIYHKFCENSNKENEIPLMDSSEIMNITWEKDENIENEVTIEAGNLVTVEDDNDQSVEAVPTWKKYKPVDLKSPKTASLKENNRKNIKLARHSLDPARRRPAPVRAFTSSALGEKYLALVEKKLEYMECLKKEHELRVEALQLDIQIKKKKLKSLP